MPCCRARSVYLRAQPIWHGGTPNGHVRCAHAVDLHRVHYRLAIAAVYVRHAVVDSACLHRLQCQHLVASGWPGFLFSGLCERSTRKASCNQKLLVSCLRSF
jgi:hypothetical protein